jgi:hypothetical protein
MARTPARLWLTILGFTLLAVAILGLIPGVVDAFHNLTFHLEGGENALHWILGFLTLGLAYLVKDDRLLATITIVYGVVYLLVGILGFMVNNLDFWHVALMDNLLHLALGAITVGTGLASRRADTTGVRTRTMT